MRLVLNADLTTVVEVTCLQRWGSTPPRRLTDYSAGQPPRHKESPFPCDHKINSRICLWEGDISTLSVDGIVHSTNETMTERNPISDRIYRRAGPGLIEDIRHEIKECRTGEVRISQGHGLPSRFIIHTVGPKYNIKYQTAAESTLHTCYRNVLQKAHELCLASLGLCVINSVRRNYPPDEGAHIALRTVRRFLEKFPDAFDVLVFVVDSSDLCIYEVLLPLYFPRSKAEENAARWQLPTEVGGLDGEPLLPDRQIRIIDNPQHTFGDKGLDLYSLGDGCLNIGEHAFSQMQGDLDQQRLLGERPCNDPISDILIKEMQHKGRYERLLRRAKTEDLSEVSGIGCLYQCGVDRFGRPVIIFVGKWFKFKEINLDKALLYLIYLLDPLVKSDYVIIYFHTLTSAANHPSFAWLREVYSILPYKYKKNLKAFYIVHPTFWTKMVSWWFTTFMAPAIKEKVFNLEGVEYLYNVIVPNQLEIPAFITEYDMTVNGLRYFQPESPT
ncbi:UNVERIFIED_CONTAM: hypothetical protein PYX00_002765 [Menopon gallinae]|uniref:Protein GDAP2 homolog n=1 Tax=Menopon gallinae TaxID=328185 RepID=A0AAW2HXY3_9NEOP